MLQQYVLEEGSLEALEDGEYCLITGTVEPLSEFVEQFSRQNGICTACVNRLECVELADHLQSRH